MMQRRLMFGLRFLSRPPLRKAIFSGSLEKPGIDIYRRGLGLSSISGTKAIGIMMD
jgi:hypothetical protein